MNFGSIGSQSYFFKYQILTSRKTEKIFFLDCFVKKSKLHFPYCLLARINVNINIFSKRSEKLYRPLILILFDVMPYCLP